MKIIRSFIVSSFLIFSLVGCTKAEDQEKYPIEGAIEAGDVVVEFFEEPQSAAITGNFRVENT
ncbi:hypothetical protein ACOI1C_22625, partial [Bacillus sp. DJP31]|uniref:hypothetical protein n=1 Tax=Bacillus sp. DJP31 TaxID=3409789 RepID=UPI003BB55F70